jgi:hypothetical protein
MNMDNFQRPQNQRQKIRQKPESSACEIEIRKTKSGKKIRIGANCTREQIKMFQDSGQINKDDLGEDFVRT